MASFSNASPSARMRAALAAARRPVSVSARRRDVRFSSDAPIRLSKRATAFDAVALERLEIGCGARKGTGLRYLREHRPGLQVGQTGHSNSGNDEFPLFLFFGSRHQPDFKRSQQRLNAEEML